jgi:hypothetical protein
MELYLHSPHIVVTWYILDLSTGTPLASPRCDHVSISSLNNACDKWLFFMKGGMFVFLSTSKFDAGQIL